MLLRKGIGFYILIIIGVLLIPGHAAAYGMHSRDYGDYGAPQSFHDKNVSQIQTSGHVVIVETAKRGNGYKSAMTLIEPSGMKFSLYGERAGDLQIGQYVTLKGRLLRENDKFQTQGKILVEEFRVLKEARKDRSLANGSRGIMVAFVSWPGSGESGFNAYQSSLADLTNWSRQASDGAFEWNPVTRVNLGLSSALDPCSSGSDPSSDSQWTSAVKSRLQSLGYNLNNYRALAIALPKGFATSCVATAYAFIPGSCSWGVQYWCGLSIYRYERSDYATLVHELGHSVSLPHANTAECLEGDSTITLTLSGECLDYEYGDMYDPMGSSFNNSMYNSAFSDQLGWMPEQEILRLNEIPGSSEVNTVTLSPYGGSGGTRSIAIKMPGQAELGGASLGVLYAEYKANAGLDSILYKWNDPLFPSSQCTSETPQHNVFLRFIPSDAASNYLNIANFTNPNSPANESYLLDINPSTDTCDAGLAPGQTWTDPSGNLNISYLSRATDLSSASIRISREYLPGGTDPPPVDGSNLNLSLRLADWEDSPNNNPLTVAFQMKSNLPLDESSVSVSDFQISSGVIREVELDYDSEYIIYVDPGRDGTITVGPSPYFSVSSTDGQSSASLNSASFVYDTRAKKAQFIQKPPKKTRKRNAVFRWREASDVSFSCSINGPRFKPCGTRREYRNLDPGINTFRIRATDKAGNTAMNSYIWVIQK